MCTTSPIWMKQTRINEWTLNNFCGQFEFDSTKYDRNMINRLWFKILKNTNEWMNEWQMKYMISCIVWNVCFSERRITVNNRETVGGPYMKLSTVHQDTYEYILDTSQADMMKQEEDTGQTVTKIIFLWPVGGAVLFIWDCHTHLFRVDESSSIWILGQIG